MLKGKPFSLLERLKECNADESETPGLVMATDKVEKGAIWSELRRRGFEDCVSGSRLF